jgi:hypothetical protein
MSGAKGPTKCQDQRAKRWHDKRMRKKECNIGDKLFMNKIHNQPSKESFHKVLRLYHATMTKVTSQGE